MDSGEKERIDVMDAASEFGIAAIMFRNALAKRLRLNLTESLCLTMLGTQGASTPTELAHFTGLTSGATTTMLDRLERRDFIRRRPNPTDRRGVIVEIDPNYGDEAYELVAGVQTAHREVVARYSKEELEIIADFLLRFAQNMHEHAALAEES